MTQPYTFHLFVHITLPLADMGSICQGKVANVFAAHSEYLHNPHSDVPAESVIRHYVGQDEPALLHWRAFRKLRDDKPIQSLAWKMSQPEAGRGYAPSFDDILATGNHLIVKAHQAKKARKPLVGPFTAKQLERAHRRNARVVEKTQRDRRAAQ